MPGEQGNGEDDRGGVPGLGRRVLAHELRTPLSAIATIAELLLDPTALNALTPEQQRQYVADVQDSALHALALIDATLDAPVAPDGRSVDIELAGAIDAKTIELAAIAERVVSTMAPLGRQRGVVIALQRPSGDAGIAAHGDGRAVRQILFNLISNALRYTPDGGRIDVVVDEACPDNSGETTPQIRVADTGGGIGSPERASGSAAARAGEARLRHHVAGGGTGLGFRVVRALADAIGATLSIESSAGSGTRATVRLRAPVEGPGASSG